MPTVLAYGADYSARELTLAELERHNQLNPTRPISALIRYIGYPDNPKCISHYPGALQRFRDAGYLVLLYVQNGWDDFLGGREGGKAAAQRALDDAREEGYPEHLPFIFACDRYLVAAKRQTIPSTTALEYLRGAAEVIGVERVWSYGFWDLQDLVLANPGTVAGHVLCGARSTNRGSLIWQENNEQPLIAGMQTDRLEFYVPLSYFEGDDMPTVDEFWNRPVPVHPGPDDPDQRPEVEADEVIGWTNKAAWDGVAETKALRKEFSEFKTELAVVLTDLRDAIGEIQTSPVSDEQLDAAVDRAQQNGGSLSDVVRKGERVAIVDGDSPGGT